MGSETPLEIRIKVALESSIVRGVVVSSIPNDHDFSTLNRTGKIFAVGADEVKYLGRIYEKIFDRAYFDGGLPVRELTYKQTENL
jgi:hypothetical protein